MDIKMKLRDFVVNTAGECVIRKAAWKEGDTFAKLYTDDITIESRGSNLTISSLDEANRALGIRLLNNKEIVIKADEHPVIEDLIGNRSALYKTTYEKWNQSLSVGHFYLVFDNQNRIIGVRFLRRLEDSFLEWEGFCINKGPDSCYTIPKTIQQSIDQLKNHKFIPLYGIGLNLNEEVINNENI